MSQPVYKRILLKLSGEALMGNNNAIDPVIVQSFCKNISEIVKAGVQVALVLGGGNIFRGEALAKAGMDRVMGDYMGMLATVINALAFKESLKQHTPCHVMSALAIDNKVCETFQYNRALQYLDQQQVLIFAAGTGNPYFTTDSAASLRAIEIKADIMLKATKVDGIYTADPKKDPNAKRYAHITYDKAIQDKLAVMDMTALALCRENNMPIMVFNIFEPEHLQRIIFGDHSVGTLVNNKGDQ